MGAIKITFHNEQEEKVLISFLDSLNYDYEPQYSTNDELAIAKSLKKSENEYVMGKTNSHEEVMKKVKSKYDL
jgi:hypothetical protein